MMSKLNKMVAKARCKAYNFIHNEKGDTNFISILVILAIVTVLIGSFLAFQEQIVGWIDNNLVKFWSGDTATINGPGTTT